MSPPGKRGGKPRSRGRGSSGGGPSREYIVPGERAVRELLGAAPERIERLLFDAQRPPADLVERAAELGLLTEHLDRQRLWERSGGADPRGVVAVAEAPRVWPLDALIERAKAANARPRMLVALDGVVDPQNLGAILRSCEFFGVAGVVWPKDRAASLTPSAVRASAGASERVPHCIVTNLATALRECKEAGLWVIGTVVDGGEDLSSLQARRALPDDRVVVLGSEERGLRRLTRELCDVLVTMPRRGALGSLNVAAAGAATLALMTADPPAEPV